MNTLLRRTLLIAVAAVPLTAGFASAQYRIDNGTARDANNRIGSGGYNDARADNVVNNRVGGLAGNYIVTGNVTGGRAFRGNVGYTDQYAFRGNLGSSDIDPFVRDSTGVAQLRGNYGANATQVQPFFGNRTVAPPPGFVRSPIDNGQFRPPEPATVQPNDSRIDYGGATRADVAQSLINSRQQYGNAGLAPTSGLQWTGPDADSPQQLSEYTSLARQRRDIFAGSDPTQRIDQPGDNSLNNGTNNFAGTNVAPNNTSNSDARPAQQQDNQQPTTPDNRRDRTSPLQAQPDANGPMNPADTGQAMTRRSSRAVDNNTQYAQLRDRLAQVRGQRDANGDNRTAGSEPLGGQPIAAGGAVTTGQGRQTTPTARTSASEGANANGEAKPEGTPANGNDATPANGTATPGSTPGSTPGATGSAMSGQPSPRTGPTATQQPKRPTAAGIGVPDNAPEDKLHIARPEGEATAAKRPAAPMQIASFAAGVKDPKLAKMLTQAESLMKSGKFGSAIDQYDRAEEIASDDPLVFMGRSIAELGGGYYRKAETHLRQAYAADESLLYAKFDLRAMLGDDRLNTLTGNLSDIAGKNERDAGPLLLLAFIYYNGGMEDRAARALDMAQVRAGGKDKDIDALRKNWNFEAAPPAADTKGDQNK